ncbi:hypothetical protein [Micromonospora sp. KC721]|uniref:hypothetical protein n=1 Tax=Micromonospora sp. KC721 TaxID=2530380 RepID=UPI00104E3137|nr:hypothetical protein [Micromonospora sp. KC721]TDB79608.1 hypothetical protein E1182_11995 [Micromonospora sp. KC721]
MSRGPRSVRLLTGHRRPASARTACRPGGPVGVGPPMWPALYPQGRAVGHARVVAVPPAQLRSYRRRVWAWRLLLAGWVGLTALAAWVGLRWIGLAGLGCPLLMASPLLGMWWCSIVDLREQESELRRGR